MGHKRQIFLAPPLNLECLVNRVRLYRQSNRLVQNPVDNVERSPLQVEPVLIRKIVNAASQDVVFGHDFCNIESVMDTLQTMSRRTVLAVSFRNRFV